MKTDQQPLDQGLKNRCTAFLVPFSVTSVPPATHPPLPGLEVNNPSTRIKGHELSVVVFILPTDSLNFLMIL